MTTTFPNQADLILPTAEDVAFAEVSSRELASVRTKKKTTLSILVQNEKEEKQIPIPSSLLRIIQDVLTNMAQGTPVTIVPAHSEFTTQQAADFLNVSRPFVIQLIETKQLPHRMVGTHRRILFSDLLDFKQRNSAARRKALEELSKLDQELGLGYR